MADFRVLMFAYACERGEGSESGAGWAVLSAASEIASHITIITRTGRSPSLEVDVLDLLPCQIDVLRIQPPRWAASRTYLAYLAWLGQSRAATRRLLRSGVKFSVMHHSTFASDWLPPPFALPPRRALIRVNKVWGPVGGASYPPIGLCLLGGSRMFFSETIRRGVTKLARRFTHALMRPQDVRTIALNGDSARAMTSGTLIGIHPNFARQAASIESRSTVNAGEVVFLGRLVEWKGPSLLLRAASTSTYVQRVVFIGDGPERAKLIKLADQLGVSAEFHGRVPHAAALQMLSTRTVMALPSFHDSAPWAAAEAADLGLTVVCLDLGGVGQMAGGNAVVVPARPSRTLQKRLGDALDLALQKPLGQPVTRWTADSLRNVLHTAYHGTGD